MILLFIFNNNKKIGLFVGKIEILRLYCLGNSDFFEIVMVCLEEMKSRFLLCVRDRLSILF